MPDKYLWLVYVGLAGLAWGTYVPIIFFGGSELGRGANARLMAILCVGGAYFVIGVLFPLTMFMTGQEKWPEWTDKSPTGLTFSSLAGVAGAVGAICVIFASQAAMGAARASGATTPIELAKYRIFIAPLIFGLAPIINTLVSSVWHPHKGVFHFDVELPGWKLWVGILMVGAGAALVLYSKEEAETQKSAAARPAVSAPAGPTGGTAS